MNRFKPVISLHGSGESVVLSNGAHADFTLMQGASGLGVRPQEISSVALPSGGSLVSHRRGTEAVIQLPILLGGTPRKRWDLRRKLERLCAGEVEVRVSRPNGVYRSRFGYYQAGLEGEYGAGEDSEDGQKIVLEIFSPSGLWKGEEQSPEFRLAGLRKRFLSDRAEPVPTGRVNLAENPSFTSLNAAMYGGGIGATSGAQLSISNEWSTSGDTSLKVAPDDSTRNTITAEVINRGNPVSGADAGKTLTVSADFHMEETQTGTLWADARRIVVRGEGNEKVAASVQAENAPGTTRLSVTFTLPSGIASWYILLANGSSTVPVWWDSLAIEEGETSGEYFDGDTPLTGDFAYGWSGERGESSSIEYEKSSTYQSPFLPIVLASSTVQGEITVEIGGDAPAYPTWVVDGPGTDLIIENDEGEHLKVLTEFSEQVTITTDPLMQDIISPNNPDGELWEFVPTKSKFFPLKPGWNKLRVSMVGAKPNSRVRLLYRETYKAGW